MLRCRQLSVFQFADFHGVCIYNYYININYIDIDSFFGVKHIKSEIRKKYIGRLKRHIGGRLRNK